MAVLTDITVRNTKPGKARREIPDGGARGLYLVVQPSGVKSFAVRYRFAGTPRKLTLQPGISLAAARVEAAGALYKVAQGIDPGGEKRATAQARHLAASDTFQAVIDEYFRREGSKPAEKQIRTLRWRQRLFERFISKTLGERPIAEIKRSEIVRLMDSIEETSGTTTADRMFTLIGRVMNWHAKRSDDFKSPLVRGMREIDRTERDRILSDDELRAVWLAADQEKGPFPAFIKFLLLTAARRAEAVRMRWDEIIGTDWFLPASRNKTKVDFVRPLSAAAQEVLAKLPRIADSPFVFTTDGRQPIGGFSRRRQHFYKLCGVSGWTLHDLRRTSRSLMSRCGVPVDHAEQCLGHVLPKIRRTYDKHEFNAEKLRAFEMLATQIERIVNPQENVLPMVRG
ncbi:MAG: tyrosine-type recombinase/integrase [Xanthobacteraceae bacterium]